MCSQVHSNRGLSILSTLVYGSLSGADLVRRILAQYSVKTVFHLAAQTQVGAAKVDPVGTLEANVRGTWNVFEAARQCGGVSVIAASSDKAYGETNELPRVPLAGSITPALSRSVNSPDSALKPKLSSLDSVRLVIAARDMNRIFYRPVEWRAGAMDPTLPYVYRRTTNDIA